MIVFAIPGDLDAPTGGYAYARRVIAELRRSGRDVAVAALGDGFPFPDEATRRAALGTIATLTTTGATVVVDGLALGVLPELASVAPGRYIALVHHPLALETGLSDADAARLRASERAALTGAAHVIATSATTARGIVSDYGVAAPISVVRPGTDPAAFATGSGGVPALLSVGSLVPRKGHDVVIAALTHLGDVACRLTIAGDGGRDAGTMAAIAAQISRMGFCDRVTLAGAVPPDALERLYAGADLFVLASRHEGYGMACAEAIAHGLPVVATRVGAIPEVVGGDGVLVPPDDPAALAAALRPLLSDTAARAALAARARAAAAHLPRWGDAGAAFGQIVDSLQVVDA